MTRNIERIFVVIVTLSSSYGELLILPFILYTIFELTSENFHKEQLSFLITIFSFSLYLSTALALSLKRNNWLHLIWVEKIPNILVVYYLTIYNFMYILIKSIISSQGLVQISAIKTGVIIGNLSILLFSYQTKPWLRIGFEEKLKRMKRLSKKADLTKSEWTVIQPLLVKTANERKKPNWIWRVLEVAIVIGLGSILDAYAGKIADIVQNMFFH